jgi:hypothetical protein
MVESPENSSDLGGIVFNCRSEIDTLQTLQKAEIGKLTSATALLLSHSPPLCSSPQNLDVPVLRFREDFGGSRRPDADLLLPSMVIATKGRSVSGAKLSFISIVLCPSMWVLKCDFVWEEFGVRVEQVDGLNGIWRF